MFEPREVPQEYDPEWLRTLLVELAEALEDARDSVLLKELNVAPDRPRNGMVVLADGTNWNPGSGAGYYGYRGGSWVLLG